MKHIQNYSAYNLNENETFLNDEIARIIEAYTLQDYAKLDESLQLLSEGLIGNSFKKLFGKIFPKDLTTEQLIIHYAQYASLIASFIPGIGSTASLSVEVVLILYWVYKYSTAKDDASRTEAASELIIGLFIVALTALMVPGARLLKGPFKMLFKGGAKGAEKALRSLSPKQLKALQSLSGKAGPALAKSETMLFKVLDKLDFMLPKGLSRGLKTAFTRFKTNINSLSKKGIKQGDEAFSATTKASKDMAQVYAKALKNPAVDEASANMLAARLKAAKYPDKKIAKIFDKLSKDSTGGLEVFDDILASKKFGQRANVFDKKMLDNYKIQYLGKQKSVSKALKDFEKKLTKIPKGKIKPDDKYYSFLGGEPTTTWGHKLIDGGKYLVSLPFKLAKNAALTLVKLLTYTNRQIAYVVDEKLTDGEVLASFKGGLDKIPGTKKSKDYLNKHPEMLIVRYAEQGVTYKPMNYKTNKAGAEPIKHSEFIGMKMFLDNASDTNLFKDYNIPESENGYIEYYSIVSVDTTPELSSLLAFAVEFTTDDDILYAVTIDKSNRKFSLVPFESYGKVTTAEIIPFNEASDITQQNYAIVKNRIKDYEEDERPEQKRLVNLLNLNRMNSVDRKKYKKLFMRDLDDIKDVEQIISDEQKAKTAAA